MLGLAASLLLTAAAAPAAASPSAPAPQAPAAPAPRPEASPVEGTLRAVDLPARRATLEVGERTVALRLDRNTMVLLPDRLGTVLDLRPGERVRAAFGAGGEAYWIELQRKGLAPVPDPTTPPAPAPGGAPEPAATPAAAGAPAPATDAAAPRP